MRGPWRAAALTAAVAAALTGQPHGRATVMPPPPTVDTFGAATAPTPGTAYGPLPQLKPPDTNTTIYVTGRVVLDGGGAPPETVAIERVCVNSREIKGYTDEKGRFSIDLRRSNRLVFDA